PYLRVGSKGLLDELGGSLLGKFPVASDLITSYDPRHVIKVTKTTLVVSHLIDNLTPYRMILSVDRRGANTFGHSYRCP
ncbi:hypothetical protein HAX54_013380, partial [Datura stramonium]|nr:hypothetical protein [Datura stramonium]